MRIIGHIWRVTGLNILMQKLATFAYAQVTCHTITIYSISALHESICEQYPHISLQGDQYLKCAFLPFILFIRTMWLSQLTGWHLHNTPNIVYVKVWPMIFFLVQGYIIKTVCVTVWPIIFTCTMTCTLYKIKIKIKMFCVSLTV